MARHHILIVEDEQDGEPVRLTRREFELLRYLAQNRNASCRAIDCSNASGSIDSLLGARLLYSLRSGGLMAELVQSYKKHARWLPLFHFFVIPVLLFLLFQKVFTRGIVITGVEK